MDHAKCKENLSAYLDGELPAVERGLVEAHLADCPDCRAVLGQLNAVSGLVKKHVMEPVPAGLEKKVLGGAAPARPWLKPALAFATAAAAVLVVFNLTKTPEEAYSPGLGFGSRASVDTFQATVALENEAAAPMEPASPVSSYSAPQGAIAASRGSFGQAKLAARASAPMGAGTGGSALSGAAAAVSGAEEPQAAEFSGPVCVYVSDPGVLREADRVTLDALAFLRKNCPRTAQAAPGAVFVKKDGSRGSVPARDCSYGFILFDGVRDPRIVTDPRAVPDEYKKYFGLR